MRLAPLGRRFAARLGAAGALTVLALVAACLTAPESPASLATRAQPGLSSSRDQATRLVADGAVTLGTDSPFAPDAAVLLTGEGGAWPAPEEAPDSSGPVPPPSPPASGLSAFLPAEDVPPLTLDEIFPPRDLAALRLDPSRLRVLVATGDVIPARRVDAAVREREDDFLFPVAQTADVLRAADLTFINLEAPLISDCPLHRSGFVFCGRPGFVQALVHAGVDVAGLENNHIGNYGGRGVRATRELLKEYQIDYADRHTLAIREVRDLRFGFLAFNGVGSAIDRRAMTAAIQQARPQVDVLVVAFHWGAEYTSLPRPAPGVAPDDPVEIAHLAVDAGVDLIIGNHPHWVQAVELYEGRLITFAHGNFIFDQMWSLPTRQGVVGRYAFYDDRLVGAEFLPVLIEDSAQPRFLDGEEGEPVLERMRVASQSLAERLAGR